MLPSQWDQKAKTLHPYTRKLLPGIWELTCRFTAKSSVDETLEFVTGDTLRIAFTTKEGGSAARPHQSFILIEDPSTDLEISIPVPVKPAGKAKLDIVSPTQYIFLTIGSKGFATSIDLCGESQIEFGHRIVWRLNSLENGSRNLDASHQ